jgi:hypothetical protein
MMLIYPSHFYISSALLPLVRELRIANYDAIGCIYERSGSGSVTTQKENKC